MTPPENRCLSFFIFLTIQSVEDLAVAVSREVVAGEDPDLVLFALRGGGGVEWAFLRGSVGGEWDEDEEEEERE